MLRKLLVAVILISSSQFSSAQSDSLHFVRTKWQKKRINSTSKLFTKQFNNLFGSNQNISYVAVRNHSKKARLAVGQEVKLLKPTSTFAKQHDAAAAVNGTFFDIENGGSVDFIKVGDSVYATNRLDNGVTRAGHQRSAIVINNGMLSIEKWDGTADWERQLKGQDVMVSGPLLRVNGTDETLDSGSFAETRHPRTAVGVAGNKVIMLTVDGRQTNSAGMSLFELSRIMRWLGCSAAINLDGGGSTTLWVDGATDNGVVNYPSDNKKWDHHGERNVANVILLKKKP